MARATAALHAFNRGEVSKIALARVDAERLRLAAQCQVNWMPFVVGPMMLRPGMRFIGQVRNDLPCQVMDFFFARGDTALIELTVNTARFWLNESLLTRPSVATTVSDGAFAGGGSWSTADTTAGCTTTITGGAMTLTATARGGLARASQAVAVAAADQNVEHGLRIVVTNGPVTLRAGSAMGAANLIPDTVLDTGTHSLSVTPTGATLNLQIESTDARSKTLSSCTIEAGGVVTVPTPWSAADFDNLRWTRSGDIIYVGCYGKRQYKIERRGVRPAARGWSIVEYRSDNGPFSQPATVNASLTPSVMEGNGTLTSDQPFFTTGHVGALFRIFTPGQTNRTRLGAAGVYTEPIRVAGLDNDRKFGWTVTGTWSGRLTLQRSVTGPATGFVDVASVTGNALTTQNDSSTYNNVICWYRVGFKPGDYVSGAADVYFGQTVAGSGSQEESGTVSAENTFIDPVQTSGTPGDGRKFGLVAEGSGFEGVVTVQQSLISGSGPWTDYLSIPFDDPSADPTYAIQIDDGRSAGDAWYRAGVKTGDYVAGSIDLVLRTLQFGDEGGSATNGAAALAGGRSGICRVTSYNSSTSVNIEVLSPFSSASPSRVWQESDWSNFSGWPTAPAFHEGRLWWLGARMWGSQSNAYTGFAQADADGNALGDSGAIIQTFGEGPVDRINWGLPLSRLLCGRESAIASIRSSSFDEPVTATNFSVKDCSEERAERLPAAKAGKRGLFVSGRKVYEAEFVGQQMDYDTRDLTRLNPDIGTSRFTDLTFAVNPEKTLYLSREDGQVACLLYDRNDEVEAWWRWMTLGVVERVRRVEPPVDEDRIYFVVKRVINGVTRRFIERRVSHLNCAGGASNLLLNSLVSYSGIPTASITLAHLPNTEVGIWADGAYRGTVTTNGAGVAQLGEHYSNVAAGLTGSVRTAAAPAHETITQMTGLSAYNGYPCEVFADQQPSGRMQHVGTLTVSGGAITLPNGWRASKIVACFGYVAPFMSAKLAYAAQNGSALTQTKQVDTIGLVLFDAGAPSLTVGQRMDALDPLPAMEDGGDVPADAVWSEYDEPMIRIPGEWDTDARLCLLAQAPHPVKVGAVLLDIKTNEKNLSG